MADSTERRARRGLSPGAAIRAPLPPAARPPTLEGFGACQAEALLAAWQLLADNLDLVYWAMCKAFGPNEGDCVARAILRCPDPPAPTVSEPRQ